MLTKAQAKKIIGGEDPIDTIGGCGTCTWGDAFPNSKACTSGRWGGCDCPGGSYACIK